MFCLFYCEKNNRLFFYEQHGEILEGKQLFFW